MPKSVWTLPGVGRLQRLFRCLFLSLSLGHDNVDSEDWDSDEDEQHDISIEKTTAQKNTSKNDKEKSGNNDEDR